MTGGSGCVENGRTGACIAGNTSCDHSPTSNSKRMKTVRKYERVYCRHCECCISNLLGMFIIIDFIALPLKVGRNM